MRRKRRKKQLSKPMKNSHSKAARKLLGQEKSHYYSLIRYHDLKESSSISKK